MLRRWILRWLCSLAVLTAARGQDDAASRRAAIEGMYPVMLQALEAKAFNRARNICDQAILWEPQNPIHHYNMACIEAQAGRPSQAFGALELAVALGFNDPQHFQNDPDLALLRKDPKFADLLRKVTSNAIAAGGGPAIGLTDAASKRPAPAKPPINIEQPPPPSFQDGRPIGLYFMTRFWASTRSLEKAAWYFAPDGTVFQNLESGFSAEDLASHAGPKGKCAVTGQKLEVTWADGKKVSSTLKESTSGSGFSWNAGIFSAVKAFERMEEVAGVYEGGESLAVGGNTAALARRLELRADGTFTWSGVSFANTTGDTSRVTVGGTDATAGRWEVRGLSLVLTDSAGVVVRRIAFPYDDESTPLKPDRIFFGGVLYNKK